MQKLFYIQFLIIACVACNGPNTSKSVEQIQQEKKDSLENVLKEQEEIERNRPRTANDITIEKDISFDKYTLEDKYKYNDTFRVFQWKKIKEKLAYIENFQRSKHLYGVVSNYRNKNGESPTVPNYVRNEYKRVSDTLGTERYQSAPLYKLTEHELPEIYARDGSLVSILSSDTLDYVKIKGLSNFEGEWEIPKRYVKSISDTISFKHLVIVDVTNQNICTLEHQNDIWYVKSMNKATTGKHNPPYGMETPTGIFVVQEQKSKMFYYKDGTTEIAGFAPWASRFTNGAYIHGIPVNDPKGKIIETSWSLGTVPRSHMCVRNASSHSKFVYDWVKPYQSLVIVID